MARRHRHEEHINHEAWAIPYGDLITLLLAFFVVMYAISSVNEGKYRVLSDSLVSAFKNPPTSLQPIEVGSVARSPEPRPEAPMAAGGAAVELAPLPSPPVIAHEPAQIESLRMGGDEQSIAAMADRIERAMRPLIEKDLIEVRRSRYWVEVDIKTSLLFGSGSAAPSLQALPALRELAAILAPIPNRIHVEGFTDNLPINTSVYPSNWELSAARAASVVRLFAEYGVDPERMAAIGFGEHRPIADNVTEQGRAQNRRVVLVVMGARPQGGAPQPELLREDLAPIVGEGGV